jgi:ligand-binding sensor domain-containing protein
VPGTPTEARVIGTDGTDVWVGTNTGVRRYNTTTQAWSDIGPDLPGLNRIRSLFWTGTTMWAGASRNFFRYTGRERPGTHFLRTRSRIVITWEAVRSPVR